MIPASAVSNIVCPTPTQSFLLEISFLPHFREKEKRGINLKNRCVERA
jgi:hypothetical protein